MTDPPPPEPSPQAPIVRFEGVSKRFGAVAAVDAVSLDLRAGEFFCLLGPSGCGKSTMLRLLAGFEEPDAGRVLLEGRDLAGVPPHRRPLNMMFQSYALFPHLSVAGNIAYGLRGQGRGATIARVAELVRLVRLDGLEERRPAQLSGGQRQRVALARALARRPRVLVLDEPLGALDRRLREETQGELRRLQAGLGTTFLVVTHDQEEAMAMADRIGIMRAGRLVQVDAPRALYEAPADRFVAGFLGDVNLVEGTAAAVPGAAGAAAGGGVGVLTAYGPLPAAGVAAPGERVALAIRPERLRLLPDGPAEGPRLEGRVVEATFVGDRTHLRVALADGLVLRVTRPAEEAVPEAGAAVRLTYAPAAARLLPEEER